MPYTVRHIIDTDVTSFWRLYFDAEFNRVLFRETLDYLRYQLVEEQTDREGAVHRRVECTPNVQAPAWVQKLVGDAGYSEIGRYVPGVKYVAEWLPRKGADKFSTRFELWAEPTRDGRCERVMVVDNIINIFGIGAWVARKTEQSQRDLLTKVADFNNRWIHERGL